MKMIKPTQETEPHIRAWALGIFRQFPNSKDTAETLADYVLTLLYHEERDTDLKSFFRESLEEFLESDTDAILNVMIPGLVEGVYMPGHREDNQPQQKRVQQRDEGTGLSLGNADWNSQPGGNISTDDANPVGNRETSEWDGTTKPTVTQQTIGRTVASHQGGERGVDRARSRSPGYRHEGNRQRSRSPHHSGGHQQRRKDGTRGDYSARSRLGPRPYYGQQYQQGGMEFRHSQPMAGMGFNNPAARPFGALNAANPFSGGHLRQSESESPEIRTEESNKEIILSNIPQDYLDEDRIRDFFSKFGKVRTVRVYPETQKAMVAFFDPDEAKSAYNTSEPIFGNRFVAMHWRRRPGTQALSSLTPTRESPHDGSQQLQQQQQQVQKPMMPFPGGFYPARPYPAFYQQQPQPPMQFVWPPQRQFVPNPRPPHSVVASSGMESRRKRREELLGKLNGYIEEQKTMIKKAEDPSVTDEARKLIIQLLKKLDMLTTQTKAELDKLDAEEAADKSAVSAAPIFRPAFAARGRGRGRGGITAVYRASLKVDNRPRTIKVSNLPPAILPMVEQEFSQFGVVTKIEVNDSDNSALIQYQERWQAEEAYNKANSSIKNLKDNLNIEWVTELPQHWATDKSSEGTSNSVNGKQSMQPQTSSGDNEGVMAQGAGNDSEDEDARRIR